MQPTLLFIDELDAVCPPRGAYADAISQEFTAQLLQEVDGLLSDFQAVFLVAGLTTPTAWAARSTYLQRAKTHHYGAVNHALYHTLDLTNVASRKTRHPLYRCQPCAPPEGYS
jgi:hypothetical protein